MTAAAFQAIHDHCRAGGYDFELALRTAERDGVPWYVPKRPARAALGETAFCTTCGAVYRVSDGHYCSGKAAS